ncbi:lipase family protein [Shewanella frigidimarina]|uniref:lipase family protein n=1 Tax=Shewanella frigidimarina TaxID=56812 RepID=UPI003D7B941F
MKILTPILASNLAEFAYDSEYIKKDNISKINTPAMLAKQFLFNAQKSTLHGVSGTTAEHVLNHTSGFGFFGMGRNEGMFKGEAVLAFRGTAGMCDALTDLHCGVTSGPNNQLVHSGFNRTFNSMKPQIATLLEKLGNKPIHCVGHSLGGALANLAAIWIRKTFKIPVKLYTFGSPRVGFAPYAIQAETSLSAIYRAVHRSDPVPMVPVWPFVHAGDEYRLSTCVSFVGASHKMKGNAPGYINTASRYADYKQMQMGSICNLEHVRLKYEKRHLACFNAHWSDKISAGLIWLLRSSGKLTSILAQVGVSSTLSIYDLIARSLVELSQMTREYAEDCKGLLGHILTFVGKPSVKIVDLSYSTVRSILSMLLSRLKSVVVEAVGLVY